MKVGNLLNRSKYSRLWYTSTSVAILFAAASIPAQQSVTKYTLDQPVTNQPYLNQCNGETVMMNGTMHFEYFFSTDADGDKTDYHVTSMTQLTGVGQTTGATYVAKNSNSYHTVTKESSASDFTSTEKTRLVAQGPTPDMILRQRVHVVVDGKGNIHADTDTQTVTCK